MLKIMRILNIHLVQSRKFNRIGRLIASKINRDRDRDMEINLILLNSR